MTNFELHDEVAGQTLLGIETAELWLEANVSDQADHFIEDVQIPCTWVEEDDYYIYGLNTAVQFYMDEGCLFNSDFQALSTCDEEAHPIAALVRIEVLGSKQIEIPVDSWNNGKYTPTGTVWIEPGQVYDCPKHGDEALEFLYTSTNVYITAKTLADLINGGFISIR